MAALFASTLFFSAALVFWVQPLVGRMFLPLLGGKPAVWNMCLLFFQTLLLGGYLLAHLLSKHFTLKAQICLLALLLIGAGLLLPLQISGQTLSSLPSDTDPSFWLLRSLLLSVGPPFLVLCANGLLLQNWFSLSTHSRAKDPYFLYSASNAGSLIALLAGPVLLDPKSGLQTQSLLWSASYLLLLPLLLLCGWMSYRSERKAIHFPSDVLPEPAAASLVSSRAGWVARFRWTCLAFVPASLMMAVTSYISNDIATIPLFWVLPLAVYLLTFILAFAKISRPLLRPLARVFPILAIAMVYTFLSEANDPPWLLLLLHLLFLFVAAMVLHGRLAEERPPPVALTEFFLCLSFGGMCAGTFNALVAPNLFNFVAEYPIGILLACLLAPQIAKTPLSSRPWFDFVLPATLGLLTVALSKLVSEWPSTSLHLRPALVFGLPVIACYIAVDRRLRFALALAAILLASSFYVPAQGRVLYRTRNFFGVSQVTLDRSGNFHRLVHGNTLHGIQSANLTLSGCEPLAYYHRSGPLGQILAAFQAFQGAPGTPHIAVVGLGIGSMLSYARPDETWTFYEIDPAVVRIARDTNYFTCLQNPSAKDFRIVMGDARVQLALAPEASYGLILLDAFSSDAIPLHLLSQQAVDLYLGKLAPNGLLAFHISNRYLNLEPVLATLAQGAHLTMLARDDSEADLPRGKEESHWVILARRRSDLGPLLKDARWFPVKAPVGSKPWTDDFSNILGVFRWN